MAVLNPKKQFNRKASVNTKLGKNGIPLNTRDAIAVEKIYDDGIFLIDSSQPMKLFDRCYIFRDINYCNKDNDERLPILNAVQLFLNSMSTDFKITVANEYRDMKKFLDGIFQMKNKDRYPDFFKGINDWKDQALDASDIQDIERVFYLTVSARMDSEEDARRYFSALDVDIDKLFIGMGSEITPLNAQERLKCIRRFFYRDEDLSSIDTKDKDGDPMLDVIPISIEAGDRDYMIVNGKMYVSTLFARKYDTKLKDTASIYNIVNVPYPSFITLDNVPVERSLMKDMIKYLTINNDRAIAQEIDAKKNAGQLMAGVSEARTRKKDDLEETAEKIDATNDGCLVSGLLITVTADSLEELEHRIKMMQQNGKESGMILDVYQWRQLQAFNTALPIGSRLVTAMRAFLTSTAAVLHPFHAQDLIEQNGIFYGINMTTKNPVFADRKSLTSPHGMIVGHTGGGKSFLLKLTEISQTLLSCDDDMTCIDPQNELYSLCMTHGGQFLDFTPKSDIHINPMEIPQDIIKSRDKAATEHFVAGVTDWLNSFCAAVMRGINYTQEYHSFMGRAARTVYERCFAGRKVKQPTLKDIRKELIRMEKTSDHQADKDILHRIVNSLEDYTDGAYDMFAYPSNCDINNRFVVFGLKSVPEDLWEPVMITIMFFLTNRMEYNQKIQRATRLVIDETQLVTSRPGSAKILLNAVLTYRKYGGICTFVLQNLTHAFDVPELRDMFSNCGYKCFLDQGGVDADALAAIQPLSMVERAKLSQSQPGEAVMIWNKKVILLNCRLDKDNIMYEMISTNFHEKAAGKKNEIELTVEPEVPENASDEPYSGIEAEDLPGENASDQDEIAVDSAIKKETDVSVNEKTDDSYAQLISQIRLLGTDIPLNADDISDIFGVDKAVAEKLAEHI